MTFDWVRFFEDRGIEYGKHHVVRGNVSVCCPFCSDDPTQHMHVGLEGQGWMCWRNHDHRGRSPVRLVQALLRCTREQADIVVYGAPQIRSDFEGQMLALANKQPEEAPSPLQVPDTFDRFRGKPSQRAFINYVKRRGFSEDGFVRLAQRYDIRYCLQGEFGYRIVFLSKIGERTMAWTGRTISPSEPLRYKTHGPIGHALMWNKQIAESGCRVVVLVEGPFDALKLNFLGENMGLCSTCFCTSTPSAAQFDQLYALLPRFRRSYIMLDQGMWEQARRVADRLASIGLQVLDLPAGVKDPGEMRGEHLRRVLGKVG